MGPVDPDLRALQDVRDCVERAVRAQAQVAHASQADVDRVCEAMAKASHTDRKSTRLNSSHT